MKTLVLGNGFDLDHDLPTRYIDFLYFIEEVNRTERIIEGLEPCRNKTKFQQYVFQLFGVTEKREMKDKILSMIDSNMWIEYFLCVKDELGENWIDFEAEISQVVQDLERVKDYITDEMRKGVKDINVPAFMKRKLNKIPFDPVALYKDGNEKDVQKYISKWSEDLERMIRLLEIYLYDYVRSLNIEYFSPDVHELNIDRVISFNYTDTYERMYSYGRKSISYNYIHGKAMDNTAKTCNMVLGIDEYLTGDKRNKKTEFIQFKKYYQRIHKRTACEYVNWFDKEDQDISKERNEVYIFGHSLDITDGDVLSTIINCPNTYVIIYYYDDVAYGKQIANLVSLLGQEVLLNKVYGKNPRIVFRHQKEHKKVIDSEYEISLDMYKLKHLYEFNNMQAQEIIDSVINKITKRNIYYFGNQKNVVDMYDVLREIGLAKENRYKLLDLAEVIYNKTQPEQKALINIPLLECEDYDEARHWDKETENFICEINKYNQRKYENSVVFPQNEQAGEEKYLLYPNRIKKGYSINDYEKTFQYAWEKMDSSTNDTRKVLDALATIALRLDKGDVKEFYDEKAKRLKNPISQSRIKYIVSCYEQKYKQWIENLSEYEKQLLKVNEQTRALRRRTESSNITSMPF